MSAEAKWGHFSSMYLGVLKRTPTDTNCQRDITSMPPLLNGKLNYDRMRIL